MGEVSFGCLLTLKGGEKKVLVNYKHFAIHLSYCLVSLLLTAPHYSTSISKHNHLSLLLGTAMSHLPLQFIFWRLSVLIPCLKMSSLSLVLCHSYFTGNLNILESMLHCEINSHYFMSQSRSHRSAD